MDVYSYPTLYFFRKSARHDVLSFDGPKKVEAWKIFLSEYSDLYKEYLAKHPEEKIEKE